MGKNHASEPLTSVNGTVSQVIEVDDFTNWPAFFRMLEVSFWATVDSVLWTFMNVSITFVFIVICPFWFVLQMFLKNTPKISGGSAVSQPAPALYLNYYYKLKANNWTLSDEIIRKLDTAKSYDFDLAEFFLHLCAIVYEPASTVDKFFEGWKSRITDLNHIRFGQEGCCILAIFSVEKNFVVFSFKGTSPYDLCEWLTDASMRKSSPSNGVLPGLVHTGFFSSFGFPEYDYVSRPKDSSTEKDFKAGKVIDFDTIPRGVLPTQTPNDYDPDFWCSCIYPHILAIRSRFPKDAKPNLWITGHSLGAATASIFTSYVLWSRSDVGNHATVPSIDWDLYFKIRGTYTFGTPRVGDSDFKRAIEESVEKYGNYQFYRTINSNDIVCSVPGLFSQSIGAYIQKRKANPYSDGLVSAENDTKVSSSDLTKVSSDGTKGSSDVDGEEHVHGRPSGLTLLDFKHVGNAVLLGLRDGTITKKERGIVDFTRELIMQVPTALYELVVPGARGSSEDAQYQDNWVQFFMLLGIVFSGGVFGLLKDHYPSEYLINLDIAKRNHKKEINW